MNQPKDVVYNKFEDTIYILMAGTRAALIALGGRC